MSDERNPVRLYVTHAWTADDEYLRVFEFLESSRNFYYRNVTRPAERPPGGRDAELDGLRRMIDQAEVVLALAAQYPGNAFWIDFQATYAKAMRKPVVLLSCFGGGGVLPATLAAQADETVGWSERSIVDALRLLARHEQTNRWQTIDFTLD